MFCNNYCPHGGICELDAPHPGELHDSGYCRWSTAESVTREVADALLSGFPGGAEIAALQRLFEEEAD